MVAGGERFSGDVGSLSVKFKHSRFHLTSGHLINPLCHRSTSIVLTSQPCFPLSNNIGFPSISSVLWTVFMFPLFLYLCHSICSEIKLSRRPSSLHCSHFISSLHSFLSNKLLCFGSAFPKLPLFLPYNRPVSSIFTNHQDRAI